MKLPFSSVARPTLQMQPLIDARSLARMSVCRRFLRTLPVAVLSALALYATPFYAQILSQPPDNFPTRNPRIGKLSTLPATQPTSLPETPASPTPAANTLPAPIAATPVGPGQPVTHPHRAQVTFDGSQLNVRANDSSLNQILRAISRQTGLKITGGVQDQRVFGDYGPASMASILATLLDGTGTNIMLLEGDTSTPPELILTSRGGGPTPPSPSAPGFDDGPDPAPESPAQTLPNRQFLAPQTQGNQPVATGPQPIPQPANNINGSPSNTTQSASTIPTVQSVPTDSISTPSTAPSVSGIVDSPNPPPTGSTTGTQPNGTLTPEQVYQQLLQQQQQQKPSPMATPVTQPAQQPQ